MIRRHINNTFYENLHEKWLNEYAHPIALLRAENAVRNPWISKVLQNTFERSVHFLDIGCGAGFLANPLAKQGHIVTGVDLSLSSLRIAQGSDTTKKVTYLQANATSLPFSANTFDAACAMDLLEHVEHPRQVIREASRVLKPGGLFFFHTFNRTLLSYLLVIKGVEWCVKNTPPNMHVHRLFIKPSELTKMCSKEGLTLHTMKGLKPELNLSIILRTLFTRTVPKDFQFAFTDSLQTGYVGYAIKTTNAF